MGNGSHHDCHHPGCEVQVSWSTNSCYCLEHRVAEDKTRWDGYDPVTMTYPCTTTGCTWRISKDAYKAGIKHCPKHTEATQEGISPAHHDKSVDMRMSSTVAQRLMSHRLVGESLDSTLTRILDAQDHLAAFVMAAIPAIKGK